MNAHTLRDLRLVWNTSHAIITHMEETILVSFTLQSENWTSYELATMENIIVFDRNSSWKIFKYRKIIIVIHEFRFRFFLKIKSFDWDNFAFILESRRFFALFDKESTNNYCTFFNVKVQYIFYISALLHLISPFKFSRLLNILLNCS